MLTTHAKIRSLGASFVATGQTSAGIQLLAIMDEGLSALELRKAYAEINREIMNNPELTEHDAVYPLISKESWAEKRRDGTTTLGYWEYARKFTELLC